ncbi:MAG TPA: DUF962 domain-containing protein [Spongiibacteraceae bacterium]|jgi:hypothetical protein
MNSTNGPSQKYNSFREFYPFYLREHSTRACRRLHFLGSTLVLAIIIFVIATEHWMLLWAAPLAGYGFAWIGHLFFEKNRPATFRYPLYSLLGDWVMFFDILRGQVKL